jgi:hypothetical protein
VAAQFAHIHNVRIYHLEKRGRQFLDGLETFAKGAQPARDELVAALAASEEAMASFLDRIEHLDHVKSWHGGPASFLGYLIAHEAHLRALVILSMRLAGQRLPREVVYNMWNWGQKGRIGDA